MIDVQSPSMTYNPISETLGVFEVEPLDRGFGHTFGNSLRRVLLSSLEGAAVTSVRVEGVQHEFTTLDGVREDVTDIILNLRGLICRLEGEQVSEIEVELNKTGPGVVTAGDISCPADLEILNPDLEIANLLDNARLEMVLTISRGRGYVQAEGNKGPNTVIGVIPVDSNFSPVDRVRFEVGAARVGQRTDYDKLTLEVQTNGSIDPRAAVAEAAEVLMGRLAIFADPENAKISGEPEPEEERPGGNLHDIMIEELELGVRSYNCLKRVGVETIGDLVSKTEAELSAIPNFGKKSIEEVKENLAAHGLGLRME
ncbi:MAG: DNA-directed RNA polymerase subunit alpha [Actinobacteria bacterium]|nr:DNA-directed RNA polymerase subunit alpha [Thermoleophilia bacterium]MCB9010456.1 DNA-directed RNA polymerase subunit alpha [Actinomycetota bacterium]